MTSVKYTSDTLNRYWSKVYPEPNTGCWLWGASTDKRSGYGWFRLEGKMCKAHKIGWSIANGQIVPFGLVIRHTCDNPPCVNPDHLLLGTQAENVRDREERGRRDVRGNRNPRRILTEESVKTIRNLYTSEDWPGSRVVGATYGVSHCAINDVVKFRSWRHL